MGRLSFSSIEIKSGSETFLHFCKQPDRQRTDLFGELRAIQRRDLMTDGNALP